MYYKNVAMVYMTLPPPPPHSKAQVCKYSSPGLSVVFLYSYIFTLANNFLRSTYFELTRFTHPWTTLVHATLRVSDVVDKCNSWLVDVTFDDVISYWRLLNVITKHVGLLLFFAAYLQDLNQNSTNNEQKRCKTKCKYKTWFFPEIHGNMNAAVPVQS